MKWLLKTEPSEYSWVCMLRDNEATWDGVRNHQARKYIKQMRIGEFAFFYHSNEKVIKGIVQISREFFDNYLFKVKFFEELKKPITLQTIKSHKILQNMQTIKQPRLSISQVSEIEWDNVMKLSLL